MSVNAENSVPTTDQTKVDSLPPEGQNQDQNSEAKIAELSAILTKRTKKLNELEGTLQTLQSTYGLDNLDDVKANLELAHSQKSDLEKAQIELKTKNDQIEKLQAYVKEDKINKVLLQVGPLADFQEDVRLRIEKDIDFTDEPKVKAGKELKDYISELKKKYPFYFASQAPSGTSSNSNVGSGGQPKKATSEMSQAELFKAALDKQKKS